MKIWFERHQFPFLHRFSGGLLTCEVESDPRQNFAAVFVQRQLSPSINLFQFQKPSSKNQVLTTLIVQDGTSAVLAVEHIVVGEGEKRKIALRILRGSLAGRMSYKNLLDFPVSEPSECTLEIAPVNGKYGPPLYASLTRSGRIRSWIERRESRQMDVKYAAIGRLLAMNSDTFVLPWSGDLEGGIVVIDGKEMTVLGTAVRVEGLGQIDVHQVAGVLLSCRW
ncbi:hypothetical protein LGH82_30625 [Mesorhizobium sp. PAMC28654]|uniref:hypothetical protein n=1 Tax=Mesorhizobium sp. PAMC28654 TaxID=2880934 RepID=UPI001D0A823B|nr:hypothetical protein [Mesorhizobium sp. PAMC28654]UDL89369.1 hypothetical protein LGH82_30625 [Mesorhizobium sp. PAMC28654]